MVHSTYASWGARDELGRLLPMSTRSPPKKSVKKRSPGRHSSVVRERDAHGRFVSPSKSPHKKSYTTSYYSSPTKHVTKHVVKYSPSSHSKNKSLSTEELHCRTWPGCIYSSMAADARARGLKVQHGIDSLHKVLHMAKMKYPEVYEQLKKSPNAWKTNAALAKYIRDMYMEKEHYYYY